MCPRGCLHAICEKATRRGLLKAGFALAAGATAATAASPFAATPVEAATTTPKSFTEIKDLTHVLYEGFPTFSGDKWFTIEHPVTWAKDKVNLNRWTLMEHTGTHMDAPIHFSEDAKSVDLIEVSDLLVPLAIVDISARAADDPDTSVTPDDIRAWEATHGPIPAGACVMMNSGWGQLLESPRFTGRDAEGRNHTPGFHPETSAMLIGERDVKGIGVDTLSLDRGLASGEFPVHYEWLGSGRWGVEAVANLETLPASGAWLFVGAPKVRGGTGGPSRIVALV
jgi:kynurenine formamidase